MDSLALQNFPTFSETARLSGEKEVTEHEMCVLIFSTTFVTNISHSAKNSESYH